ncbi:MAG: hypothetical protein FD123_3667 [Bacteroidetes bacterium]|nr:MAG: hypothetical protein FD123_3667 [Bacteroidota bacterium]
MKQTLLLAGLFASMNAMAFCGFYVAKADVKLFNKTSQVILSRNGEQTIVTMSSDFEGDVKDFAMVVPVPVILQEGDVRVVERGIFDKFDAYSGPRLVSYNERNPCRSYSRKRQVYAKYGGGGSDRGGMMPRMAESVNSVNYQVTIEAKYTVGEYDILILSAKESGGLERWLNDNGYKIPTGAKEVLDPYIKSNLKFFVVKVNLGELDKNADKNLRPIQISYKSPKFMLPIRLGMANASGPQDMIVYGLSNVGRIEVTNYRTVEMTTSKNIPLFVQKKFGPFYKDLYNKAWEREGKNVAFLEYAWNVGSTIPSSQKCDPCVSPPPIDEDLKAAGVNWLSNPNASITPGQVFFTRLHITYDRKNFPQDLMLQETPNKTNYQARYIITRPAWGDFKCPQGQAYLLKLKTRRRDELQTLAQLTGWDVKEYKDYPKEYDKYLLLDPGKTKQSSFFFADNDDENGTGFSTILISLLSLAAVLFALTRRPIHINK